MRSVWVSILSGVLLLGAAASAQPAKPAVGKFFTHDGVKLYYEDHGSGEPVLIIHGNGGSTADVKAQIEYFSKKYRVIAMDSRDHGRSADSREKLTYEKMTADQAALLDHLKTGPVNVLGWSDGGIEGLLLAIRYPAKVKKLAAMAANLNPSDKALHPEAVALIKQMVESMKAEHEKTPKLARELKVTEMMLHEPQMDPKLLESIQAPVLVLAGDHDVIADEHTLEIFHRIPNSQLCIFPNATHMIPFDDPETFNAAVDRFFRTPSEKRDRIKDFLKSIEKMKASQQMD